MLQCNLSNQSNCLLYLEEDVTTAVANAARLGVGFGAVCADVVESLNAILQRSYNDHTARPPGGGDSAGPRTPTTPAPPPPPPLGAFGQQLVAKGVAPRRPWAPKAPDAP